MNYNKEELLEIPESLYSHIDDKPFSTCLQCNKYLLDDGTEYLIERICRNYPDFGAKETIFDYALCMDCAIKLHNEMSKESQKTLHQYFIQNVDLHARTSQKDIKHSITASTSQCLVSGKPLDECKEYQICAHCVGDKVYTGNPPYMLSSEILEEIMELLSKHTQDIMNGFYQKHRTPTPGIYEPDPRLILV